METTKNFIGYEYLDVQVKRGLTLVYIDGYENFGWQLEGTESLIGKIDMVNLKFKRDRKICNKVELTRLQRQFDAVLSEIRSFENSKHTYATMAACTVGVIGTAFMAGAVFAVTSNMIILCILLAIPAFIGWIAPYFLYKKVLNKRTEHVIPYIEKKYDELYAVCERGHGLLNF